MKKFQVWIFIAEGLGFNRLGIIRQEKVEQILSLHTPYALPIPVLPIITKDHFHLPEAS